MSFVANIKNLYMISVSDVVKQRNYIHVRTTKAPLELSSNDACYKTGSMPSIMTSPIQLFA